jgi:hypothetical protein
MASLRDRALLRLSDPARLGALLSAGDPDRLRVRTMLAATYDLAAVRIEAVRDVEVASVELAHPLFPVSRRSGVWTQLVPAYTRSELTLDVPVPTDPVWVDLLVRLTVTVVTEVDPAGAEAVLARAFDDFDSLDEFRERFSFFDLDGFLAAHRISTVAELRDAFDYLVADVQLRRPTEFDPADPANTQRLGVTLAAVAVEPLDLAAGLRAARLVRTAAGSLTGTAPAGGPIEATAPYATAVLFPAAGGDTPTPAEIEQLYARDGVVSLFLTAD